MVSGIIIDVLCYQKWIYFRKTWDEIVNRFQDFKAQRENLIGNNIIVFEVR